MSSTGDIQINMPATPPPGGAAPVSTAAPPPAGRVNGDFVTSLKGILRLVETVLALIAFICSAVGRNNLKSYDYWDVPPLGAIRGGAGWCMFVSMSSFLLFLLTYFLWLFTVLDGLTPGVPVKFAEFVMFAVYSGLYLIAGIVAGSFGQYSPGLGAACFFLLVMMLVCAADAFFQQREWASSDEGPYSCCGSKPTGGGTTGAGAGAGTAQGAPPTGQQQPQQQQPTY